MSAGISTTLSTDEAESLRDAALRLADEPPQVIIRWAFDRFGDDLVIATGFGVEGVAMIDIAADINPRLQVFCIDTDFLFPETHDLKRRIEARYEIDIQAVGPDLIPDRQTAAYGDRLWNRDPDLCCRLRKLEPMRRALEGRRAWMTAIRRDQTPSRALASAVEWDRRWGLVKISPLFNWTRKDVWNHVVRNGLPYNELYDRGYTSIGCTHCTRPVRVGEDERAGRWSGQSRTECGLHVAAPLVSLERGDATPRDAG